MGAFSGLKDARRGFSSNPLRGDGRYLVRIDGCDYFEAAQKGWMWKNTLTVLAVLEGDKHRAGEQVHIFYKRNVGSQTFLSNIKTFLASVLDASDEDVDEAAADRALAEDSPMQGLVTVVTARQQVSQKKKADDGGPLTYTVYSYSPMLTPVEIVAALSPEDVARFFPSGL